MQKIPAIQNSTIREINPFNDALQYGNNIVVLFFYPEAFTPVCTSELPELSELIPKFAEVNASVYGVSSDDIETLTKYTNPDIEGSVGDLAFPLIADTKGFLLEMLNATELAKTSKRLTFILRVEADEENQPIDAELIYLEVPNQSIGRFIPNLVAQARKGRKYIQTGGKCPNDSVFVGDLKPEPIEEQSTNEPVSVKIEA